MKSNRLESKLLFKIITIIFFGVLLLGCSIETTTSSSSSTGLDYSQFSSLKVLDPSMQLNMDENSYYLYFYSESCTPCNEIKEEVLTIISGLEADKVYFVETNSTIDIFSEIDVSTTPSIVHVLNHQVESIHSGKADVLEIFHTLL